MTSLRIATRGSMLAIAQAQEVAGALRAARPELSVELAVMSTAGDRRGGSLLLAGGKGLFTAELEQAIADGQVQLAVHSAKDVPAELAEGTTIAAVPPRQDPRDALVSRKGSTIPQLAPCASVGSSSLRRRAQLLAQRDDVNIVALRGNVDTRVSKLLDAADGLDAIILAMAGLNRLNLAGRYREMIQPLDLRTFVPAAGQGALIVQAAGGSEAAAIASCIDDGPSRQALLAERAVVGQLGADCRSCLAVHVFQDQGGWAGLGMAAHGDGSGMIRAEVQGSSAGQAGGMLGEALLSKGARELVRP